MQTAIKAESRDDAFTVCLRGDPIGCGGVTMTDGNGEMWGLFSPVIKTMPVALFRATRDCLNRIVEKQKPKELFSCADIIDDKSRRFLEHLGFSKADKPSVPVADEGTFDLYSKKLEGC